jgi:acetylornithine deacetylase/succinyl-diaminopimelate desuccinylase-like protein
MNDPSQYAELNKANHVAELIEFLRIPSVSTQPERQEDVAKAASWLAQMMEAAGLEHVAVIETQRHPLVYADWLHAGEDRPTVLIYGHYDVQPAEPFERWNTQPFEPTVRDQFLYARGASDDKGQLYIHVKAVEAFLQNSGQLPVNVKFIIEGEEESGGASLSAFISQHKDMLTADVALISDTSLVDKDQPAIVYGLRGMLYTLLDIKGPGRDLHSGSYGGGINNPLNVLGHIIAQLKDENGRILIPGFYDKVRPLTSAEREILARFPLDEQSWLAETGAPQIWGEAEYSLVERLGTRPTLDVHGIIGGYTGAGGKTVLPAEVHAKISMRLVPDQDPHEIAQLYQEYIQKIAPPSVTIEVSITGSAPASITDLNMPAMKAASTAYAQIFGREPVFKREGGSIPVVAQFQQFLDLETVLMGFGLPDDKLHAPNERFYLPNYYRGIQTSIRFLEEFAALSA